jgi:Flp pilus assembly protein CpaB
LGLLLGLIAGGAVVLILLFSQPATDVQRIPVVIAAQPISQYSEISAEQVTVTQWPQLEGFTLPAGALSDPKQAVGKLALTNIPQGQAIVSTQVISKSDALVKRSNLSYILDKGSVALALPLNQQSSVASALQPGDHVDLIATFNFAPFTTTTGGFAGPLPRTVITSTITQRMLQNVLVVGVAPWNLPASSQSQQQQQQASIATLQLTEQDALIFKYTESHAEEWTFVLRPVNDEQLYNPTPMTLDYINKKFGFQFTSP